MTYQLAEVGVIRLADGLHLTRDMPEWEDYRAWLRDGNTPEPMPEPPVDMDAERAAAWARCKERRDKLEASGFPYLGHPMDSDPRSVQRINTAVQAAQAAIATGAPFGLGWTCMDGHVLPLDAAGMIGMPVALAIYANALHLAAREYKDRIAAAETPAELDALVADIDAWGAA